MQNFINQTILSMKKYSLLVVLLILTGFQLSAQKSRDILYLRNGGIIYGRLIEIKDDNYKIQTADGSLFIYRSAEVEKFGRESSFFDGRKDRGFGFTLEAGLLVGSQNSDYTAPFSFNFLGSLTSNTRNITSLGSGVEFFGRPFTPFFIEYKHIFFNRKTSPFIFGRGGAVIPLGGDEKNSSVIYSYDNSPRNYKGGGSVTFGTGISWAKAEYETYLSFAYRFARTSYIQNDYNVGNVTYKNSLSRLEIKFGYKF
jgi:hypothetical protein